MRRKLGSEISARNRRKRAEEKRNADEKVIGNTQISDKLAVSDDPYALKRKELNSVSRNVVTNKDGSVDCPTCGSNMGKMVKTGLFRKRYGYKCPTCHLVAEINNPTQEVIDKLGS